jgi:hypothetical protein
MGEDWQQWAVSGAAWLLTYLIHSTLLIAAVWLISRRLDGRPAALDALWKTALVGGLLTATLQTGAGVSPWGGRLDLAAASAAEPAVASAPADGATLAADDSADETAAHASAATRDAIATGTVERSAADAAPAKRSRSKADRSAARRERSRHAGDSIDSAAGSSAGAEADSSVRVEADSSAAASTEPAVADSAAPSGAEPALASALPPETSAPASRRESSEHLGSLAAAAGVRFGLPPAPGASAPVNPRVWLIAGFAAWGLLAGLLGFGLVRSWSRLRRLLSDRRRIESGPATTMLARLAAGSSLGRRVRLSASTRVDVPIAVGVFRPEIVVPERALVELEPAELESLLAHELAHLIRRDPAWRLIAGFLHRVLFLQPLNRVATTHLESASEVLCDDWAVQRTDHPLALARCLTEVAGWVASPLGASVPAMARRGSGLGRRVRRLVAAGDAGSTPRRDRWPIPLAAGALALVVFAAPGASDTGAVSAPASMPPAAVTFASASPAPDNAPAIAPSATDRRAQANRLLAQLRSGQVESHDVADWVALAQLLGSPDSGALPVLRSGRDGDALVTIGGVPFVTVEDLDDLDDLIEGAVNQALAGVLDIGIDLDIDIDLDGIDLQGDDDDEGEDEGEDQDSESDSDSDSDDDDSGFSFDFNFGLPDVDVDVDVDVPDPPDPPEPPEPPDAPDAHCDDDHDGHHAAHEAAREAAREAHRQAREAHRQAREQARRAVEEARRQAAQAREQGERAREQAMRQAREAHEQARRQAAQVQEQVREQLRQQHRAMVEAQRHQHRHHQGMMRRLQERREEAQRERQEAQREREAEQRQREVEQRERQREQREREREQREREREQREQL